MIGLVIVSHSAQLAAGVYELVAQLGQGRVPVATAGGLECDPPVLGTDPLRVQQAIESVYSDAGVVVLMDLGSALLSAEMAVELLPEPLRPHVHLCEAPLVEGAVAAATQIAAGAPIEHVLAEARGALAAKAAQLGVVPAPGPMPMPSVTAIPAREQQTTVRNRLGVHARPAAQMVQMAARFQSHVSVRNVTTDSPPADARSINQVMALGARQGHQLLFAASGPDADAALAAFGGLVEQGFNEGETAPPADAVPLPAAAASTTGEMVGIPVAPGIAIGPLARYHPLLPDLPQRAAAQPEVEWQRLLAAVTGARVGIEAARRQAAAHAGASEAAIFDAHLLFLDDPALLEDVHLAIFEQGLSAEMAWQGTVKRVIATLGALEDAYQRERAADVADVGRRVIQQLIGVVAGRLDLAEPAIVLAGRLSPSEIGVFDPTRVLGVCADFGSPLSHSAILARGMEIPAVMGVEAQLADLDEGTQLALDGTRGRVWVTPNAAQLSELGSARQAWLTGTRAARATAHLPACTRDGHHIEVVANVGSLAETRTALANGADGVGVLRTEFLFLNRAIAPSEDEQAAAYAAIADQLGDRPCVIRTSDVGGDKPLPYLPQENEPNPFLGWRGIRIGLERPDLLKTQLRAILRASPGHQIKVMLPMISSCAEVRAARALLAEAMAELRRVSVPFDDDMEVGVMVEVPSAVMLADQLAREVAFFSIGTNDLSQYLLAADRTNPRVARLAEGLQPALLRAVHQVAQAAHAAGIRVALCGEMASDLLAVPLLGGGGMDDLSVNPAAVPAVKQAITRLTLTEAQALATVALELDSAEAVRDLLRAP
jgi:multiphosphoryl transfer protein